MALVTHDASSLVSGSKRWSSGQGTMRDRRERGEHDGQRSMHIKPFKGGSMAPSDEGQALNVAKQMIDACSPLGPMDNAGGQGVLTPQALALAPMSSH